MLIPPVAEVETPLSCGIPPGTTVQVEFVILDVDTLAAANHRTKTIQLNVLWPWHELRAAMLRELARFADHHDDPAPMTCAVVPLQHRLRRSR